MSSRRRHSAPVYDAGRVAELLGVRLSRKKLANFGPPPKPLKGYLTFFDPGWGILRLRRALAANGTGHIFESQSWYNAKAFAKKTAPPRYRRLRMDVGKDSFNKSFAEQKALLAKGEEVPLARVVIMGMVIHFLATGERLFPAVWVRTLDTIGSGRRVDIGNFVGEGLAINSDTEAERYPGVGFASARKS